jgi:hypothetical protein
MGFKRLDSEDFVVSSDTVSSTVWSGNQPTLSTFATSSTQEQGISGDYYLNVYQSELTDPSAEVQFAIAYADETGGGSIDFDSSVPGKSPSRSIFGQYRTLILEDEESSFIFGNDFESDYFYVLNIERARYKEKLLPGSLNLTLENGGNTIELTDNSQVVELPTFYGTQRAFQIVSGSNGTPYNNTGYTTNSGSYGLFLPDTSTIILNGAALDDSTEGISLSTDRSANTRSFNTRKLYNSISEFSLNSQETITSDFVFIRARNSEFNYSENPSFIKGTTGEVIYDYFIDNPQVYPSTVGLYNDANELLAVAKLSRPLQKDFTKEALIRVKLDF